MRKNNSFGKEIFSSAVADAFKKLSPRKQLENPVMFLVYMSSVLTTLFFVAGATGFYEDTPVWFFLGYSCFAVVYGAVCQFCRGDCRGQG